MGTFVVSRNSSDDKYAVWHFAHENGEVTFTRQSINQNASFNHSYQLASIGGYIMAWGPCETTNGNKGFPYQLFEFDPNSADPLNAKPVQAAIWPISKFWSYRTYYSNNPDEQKVLNLIPMGGNFMLFFVGGEGRGTYMLFNFDPDFVNPVADDAADGGTGSTTGSDPLPGCYTQQGGFPSIQSDHELIPIGNYVLDRFGDGSSYRIWSFDSQNITPLSIPQVQDGTLKGIDFKHKVVVIGENVLTWVPGEASFRLWNFNAHAQSPLSLIAEGTLPAEMVVSASLASFETRVPIATNATSDLGSIGYMRSKIKHVVYYMLESRSFDNVCGWLYEKDEGSINYIGSDEPFNGASTDNYNLDGDTKVYTSKFNNGELSNEVELADQLQDPFHDNSDSLLQMFYNKEPGYAGKAKPDMGGFVKNNANHQVMLTFAPEQLPVINGLAKNFAVSDEWFSSVPGGTDINRAFSVSGSGLNRLDTWEGGSPYEYWPQYPHRQSIWKVLWNNGIKDWKIYNAILWLNHPFTYHLYLEGQVPSLDALIQKQANQFEPTNFLDSIDNFKTQAQNGMLPAFSFLEPVWISPNGTSSYHPGADLVPAEVTLNEIYEAIKSGPDWESTLLVVTFSKSGGIYDHVSPPYATKPWPNDSVNDFNYDLMGARVPTILVSPLIKKNTVFRSGGKIPYDSTSFAATLLKWFGIPKSRWGLGDRMDQAPTFEGVFLEPEARTDAPTLSIPYDNKFPKS
ncbi:alkaline phosphatase family protein [Mucilaginibacter agri]|uniref:Phosphoesterase n=1 Tax=Mucilaginibacter agri TaxID=2695265 RepID=A0A965ZJT2_9SPHI|nr:alkaline phosphatase family protein [Mucilaginibacter agri]NCD72469.1 phosphoesterase [Mucilaginibacter agri]